MSAAGAWFGGFPNVFVVTDIPIFELNGTTFFGYSAYLILFCLWLVIAQVTQNISKRNRETYAVESGPHGVMKRMII